MTPGWTAYATVAALDTVAAGMGARRPRWVTKPALMPLLAGASGPGGPRAALVGSWAGDVALLGVGDAAVAGGIGGFAVAHLGYLRRLRSLHRSSAPVAAEPVAALGFAVAAVAATAAIGSRLTDRRALCVPVAAYAALVTAMGHAAVVTGLRRRDDTGRRLGVGGTLFVVSDALVALSLFGGVDGRRAAAVDAAAMATYTAAQALLASGLAAAGVPAAGPGDAGPCTAVGLQR